MLRHLLKRAGRRAVVQAPTRESLDRKGNESFLSQNYRWSSPLEARIAMDPGTFDAESVPTTKVERLIKRIDRSIALLEANTSPLDQVNWCKLRSAWRDRHRLGLARKIECRRAIICLNRWRYGFEVEAPSLASTEHAVPELWRGGAFEVISGHRA
jgi:hypothetical protein